jgi:hypothetical protein
MKMRMFLMIFVAAVLAPAVQAIVLDNMDNVLSSNGGLWHDERAYSPALLKQNTNLAYVHEGTGSMQIDYSEFTGTQYDVVPRANIVMPDLSNGISDTTPSDTLAFSFWVYTAGGDSPERMVKMMIYSNELGDAVWLYDVQPNWSGPPDAGGWVNVIAPLSDFYQEQGTMDWTDVDTIDFHFCCWMEDPYTPTGESVYVDDLQLITIPEPATMSLLALGTLAMLKRRKA